MAATTVRVCPGSDTFSPAIRQARPALGTPIGRCPACGASFELCYAGRLPSHPAIRLVLSDHHLIRSALLETLACEPGIVVELETPHSSLQATLPGVSADVVVFDAAAAGSRVAGDFARIRAASPASRIVVLSTDGSPGFVERMLTFGARGYILKSSPLDLFPDAIRSVHSGATYLDANISPLAAGLMSRTAARSELRA